MAGGTYQIYVTVDASGAVTGMRAVQSELGATQAKAKETDAVFKGLFKFFALGEIVHQLYSMTDAFLTVKSSIQVAGAQGNEAADVFNKLIEVANQTRSPVEKLADLYRNLGLYSHQLGLAQSDLLGITKSVGEAIALTGGNSQRAQNGVIQLAKALEEGKIQGQTFNALIKDFPSLIIAVAEASGHSAIELKKMAAAGTFTSAELAKMLIKAGPILDKRFERSIITLGQAFVIMENNVIGAIADIDHATNGFSLFAGVVVDISKAMRVLAPVIINLGITLVAVRVGMALFGATASTTGAAVLFFGKSMVTAEGELIAARVAFASIAGVFVLVATLALQFGDKVKFTIGPVHNLRDAVLVLAFGLQQLATRFIGIKPTLILLTGAFLSLRLGLGSYGLVFTVVIAALTRFNASSHTVILTLAGTALALTLLSKAMGGTGIAVRALTLLWQGMVVALGVLRAAWAGVAVAELAADVALAPLVIGYGLLAIAVGVVVAAIADMIAEAAGVTDLFGALSDIFGLAWDSLVQWWNDWGKTVEFVVGLVPGVGKFVEAVAKLFALAWEKLVGWIRDVYNWFLKWADSAGVTAGKILDLTHALDDNNTATGHATTAAQKHAKALADEGAAANSTASSIGRLTAANIALQQSQVGTTNNIGGGSGVGGTGHGNFTVAPLPPDETDANRLQNIGTSSSGSAQDTNHPNTVGVSDGGSIYPAGFKTFEETTGLPPYMIGPGAGLGLTAAQSTGYQDIEAAKLLKQQTTIDQKAADNAAKAAEQAAADAAKQQAALQRLEAIEQAKNQSIEQLTLQALNALSLNSASQLPSNVRDIISKASNLQGTLAGETDPIKRAEIGRQIQILTDALGTLTGAVKDASSDDNPYLKYAQNVYGELVGIQQTATQTANTASSFAASTFSLSQVSGGSSSSGSGGSSSSGSGGSSYGNGITGGSSGNGGLPLYLGAFADGGNIDIGSDGYYSAHLHAGENVSIGPANGGGSKQININMTVNGVQDADSFRRSKKQILATLYRDLMAVGEQT